MRLGFVCDGGGNSAGSSDVFANNYWLGTQSATNEFFVLNLGKPSISMKSVC